MQRYPLTYLITCLIVLALAHPAAAQGPDDERRFMPGRGWHGGQGPGMGPGRNPYGAYCPERHPEKYGARHPVRNADEARARLLQFFGAETTRIVNLEEHRRHFRADIVDRNGALLDTVIIDRRSGRIRSIL